MATFAGHNGRVIINGTTMLRAHRWSLDWKMDELDVTSFENIQYGDWIGGIKDVDITLDAYWDPVDNPFNAPIGLTPGSAVLVTLQLTKGSLTQRWSLGYCLVCSARSETGVRDTIHYSVTLRSTGIGGGNNMGSPSITTVLAADAALRPSP